MTSYDFILCLAYDALLEEQHLSEQVFPSKDKFLTGNNN